MPAARETVSPVIFQEGEMEIKEYKQYDPVKFSLLRHAYDNKGVDEWDELLKINMPDCCEDTMYKVAVWLTDNMEMFPDKDDPIQVKLKERRNRSVPDKPMRSFPRDDLIDLQFAMMETMHSHAMAQACIGPITAVGEFFFLNHCHGYNSYESFYIPIRNVLDYMCENRELLWENSEKGKENR